jgi:hypothetical protein
MDGERACMAGADLPALPGAGCGTTIGRNLADGKRLAAMLEGGVGWKGVLAKPRGCAYWGRAVEGGIQVDRL